MAKRSRGSVRPGQRRRIDRASRPTSSARPTSGESQTAIDAEALDPDVAAVVGGELVAAEASPKPTPSRGPSGRTRASSGGLAVQYAHEYDYVARDLRRIAILAVILLAILGVIYIFLELRGVTGL